MKFICLGYIEPGKFEGMTEDERNAVLDECFEHNDHLRANGHLVAEVPLQPPETALTLYWKNGKVASTDGPYAETKEQLGGIQTLEARDLNHAIQLVSQQPGFKYGLGPIEIRPVADLTEMMKESERRRAKGYLAMRAATRERMISIMARGCQVAILFFSWAGGPAHHLEGAPPFDFRAGSSCFAWVGGSATSRPIPRTFLFA